MVGKDLVELLTHLHDEPGLDLDVARLTLSAAMWLMKHQSGVGQGVSLPLGSAGEDDRCRRRRHPHADRVHIRPDVLHRVVDREKRRYRATGGIDVEEDVLVRILRLEVEELGHDQVGDCVIDRSAQEDDSVLEEPAVNVEVALTPAGLFKDRGDHIVVGVHSSSSKISASTMAASTVSVATTSASTSLTFKLKSTGLPSSSTGLAFDRIASSALLRRISLARANS